MASPVRPSSIKVLEDQILNSQTVISEVIAQIKQNNHNLEDINNKIDRVA